MRIHLNGNHFELRQVGIYVEVTVNWDEVWMCEPEEVSEFIHNYGKESQL